MTKTGLWEDNLPEITQPVRSDLSLATETVLFTSMLSTLALYDLHSWVSSPLTPPIYPFSYIFLLFDSLTPSLCSLRFIFSWPGKCSGRTPGHLFFNFTQIHGFGSWELDPG